MENSTKPSDEVAPAPAAVDDRRFFIKAATVVIGGLAGVAPFLAGLCVFLDPLRRRSEAKTVRIAPLDAVPDDGVPRSFSVMAERVDAWNRFPREPIGVVYLLRKKGAETPVAFTATCPHLGCFIGYGPDSGEFHCPCHTSAFSLDGEALKGPSPRGLDTLVCKVQDGDVFVEYQNFQTGTPEKVPKV